MFLDRICKIFLLLCELPDEAENNQPSAEDVNLILPAYDIAFYAAFLYFTNPRVTPIVDPKNETVC